MLPFENLGAPEDDYFADGIADAIRGKLAGVPGIEVIARGSSTPYKKSPKTPQEIARELNVRYLLTATIRWQKAGGAQRVQVSPELVEIKEGETPATKWQQPFDASLTDVFQVQSDVAAKVVDALGVALAEKQEKNLADAPTSNVAAYDAYLKGEEATVVMARADLLASQGSGLLRAGRGARPEVCRGVGALSQCRALVYANGMRIRLSTPARSRPRGRRSSSLRTRRPATSVGWLLPAVVSDFVRALEEYQKAEKLAPGNPDPLRSIGRAEMQMGRWRDAIAHYDEAERLHQECDQRRQLHPAAALPAPLRRSAREGRPHSGPCSCQPQ